MVLSLPAWLFDNTIYNQRQEAVWVICIKLFMVCLLGGFCLTDYPPVVNFAAMACIIFIFINTLVKKDYFSLIIQLFFSNHFVFGNDKGGLFNIAALIALFLMGLSGKKGLASKSSFGRVFRLLIIVLFIFQLMSVTINTHAGDLAKVAGMLSFLGIVALIYQLSKINITKNDLVRFITVLFVFSAYELVVSLNQKYNAIPFTSTLLPKETGIEYQFGIFRCMGPFMNFEAYAEYGLSMIALLLPGILSGSFKSISSKFYYMTIGIVVISFMAILLSVTRSSFFLLPFVILIVLLYRFKKVRFKSVYPFIIIIIVGRVLNLGLKIFDISSFIERSKEMNVKNVSDIASGSEINRGEIFAYAFEKIKRSNGIIGEGYFTNPDDYNTVHFDTPKPEIGDYHNLYLSIIVFWGVPGAVAFVLIFLLTLFKGFSAAKTKEISPFDADLLLGFNLLFSFFLINQYKIIFLRESNYTIVILLLLLIYRGLIKKVAIPDVNITLADWQRLTHTHEAPVHSKAGA